VRIPSDVARKIGHYVYLYVDPRTRRPFYVGKGKGSRALAHLSTIKRSRKATLVRHLRRAHRSPQIDAEPGGLCAVLEKVSQGRLLRPPTGWYAGRMVPDLPDNGLTLDTSAVIYQLVLTKADKIKPTELADTLATTKAAIAKRPAAHPVIIATSSETSLGIAELRAEIAALA